MATPLPAGWAEYTNQADGTIYFHNATTGVTTYTRPTDLPPPPPDAAMQQPPPAPDPVPAPAPVAVENVFLSMPQPVDALPPAPPSAAVELQPVAAYSAPPPPPVAVAFVPPVPAPAANAEPRASRFGGFVPPLPSGAAPAHSRTASHPPISSALGSLFASPSAPPVPVTIVYFNIETSSSIDKSIQKGLLTITDVITGGMVMGHLKWNHLPRPSRVTGLLSPTDWLFKEYQKEVEPSSYTYQYHCENKTGAQSMATLQKGSFYMGTYSREDRPEAALGAVILSPGKAPLIVDTRTGAGAGAAAGQPQTPVSPASNSATATQPSPVLVPATPGGGAAGTMPLLPAPAQSHADHKHSGVPGQTGSVVFGNASVVEAAAVSSVANASLLPAAGSNTLVSPNAVFLTLETKNSATAMVFRGRLFINSIDPASGKLDGWLVRPPYQLDACAISGQTFPTECRLVEHQKATLVNGIDYAYTVDTVAGALSMEIISKPDFKASGTYRPLDAQHASGEVIIAHANAHAWAELKAERALASKTVSEQLEEEAKKYPRDKHGDIKYFYCERCNHFVNKLDNAESVKSGDHDCWHHPYPLSKRLRDASTGEPLFACCRRPNDSRWTKMGWGGNGCSVAAHDTGACCTIS